MRRGDAGNLPGQTFSPSKPQTLQSQLPPPGSSAPTANSSRGGVPVNGSNDRGESSKSGGIPGYVSKFTPHLDASDKALIETAQDTYANRTDWNLTFSSESSLFYSSKTVRQLAEDHKKKLGVAEEEDEDSKEHPLMKLLFPGALATVAGAYFLSFILPGFLNFFLSLIAVGAAGFHLFREKKKFDEENEESGQIGFKPYKIKLISYVVGLPDDVAKAFTSEDSRKKWDIISNLLNEKSEFTHLFKKNALNFYILDKRMSRSRNPRETLIEMTKIKGKPYFLKLVAYSTVTAEMSEKVGEEAIKNSYNSLRNFVTIEDSVSELNVSFSNLKTEGSTLSGTPTLTITDMIGEIEEIDMGDDGATEVDEEEGKERMSIIEEVKVAGANPTGTAPSPSKELTFDEKFELDVQKAPAHEQDIIRTAKESVDILLKLADHPDWKQIKTKPNNVFSMDAEGGLK